MAIETKHRETNLSDDADIYKTHKDIPEKEKWKSMNRTERVTHFKDYYAIPLLIAVIVTGIAAYLIIDAVTGYRNTVFMATVINDRFDNDSLEKFNEDFLNYLGCDSKKDKAEIRDGYIMSGGSSSEAMSAAESITSYIYAKQLDAMICDTSTFDHYASLGCFTDLGELLTDEQYEKYSDYIYYPVLEEARNNTVSPDTDTIRPDKTYPCGIYLGDSPVYKSLNGVQPNPVIGIIITSGRSENAVKLLEYLFPDNP